jgi:hypothetical protein
VVRPQGASLHQTFADLDVLDRAIHAAVNKLNRASAGRQGYSLPVADPSIAERPDRGISCLNAAQIGRPSGESQIDALICRMAG